MVGPPLWKRLEWKSIGMIIYSQVRWENRKLMATKPPTSNNNRHSTIHKARDKWMTVDDGEHHSKKDALLWCFASRSSRSWSAHFWGTQIVWAQIVDSSSASRITIVIDHSGDLGSSILHQLRFSDDTKSAQNSGSAGQFLSESLSVHFARICPIEPQGSIVPTFGVKKAPRWHPSTTPTNPPEVFHRWDRRHLRAPFAISWGHQTGGAAAGGRNPLFYTAGFSGHSQMGNSNHRESGLFHWHQFDHWSFSTDPKNPWKHTLCGNQPHNSTNVNARRKESGGVRWPRRPAWSTCRTQPCSWLASWREVLPTAGRCLIWWWLWSNWT